MDTNITLITEFHRAGFVFAEEQEPVQVQLTDNGIFVKGQKITDIFFNNIQLRLYISGDYKTDNTGTGVWKYPFHMIFDDNENDAELSFQELYKKISAHFVPAQA
jgi:hypothetical protein